MKWQDVILLAGVLAVGFVAWRVLKAQSSGGTMMRAGPTAAPAINMLNAGPIESYDALGFRTA